MSESSYQTLRVERDEHVALVRLTRPERLNSLTQQTMDELRDAATQLREDERVRCIGLTGDADAFSAGADLNQLAGDSTDESVIRQLASSLHEAICQLYRADKPVVTGVNGTAAGAGFGLALCGDVVLVSEDAHLEYAYPKVGLTGDGGSTFFLPRLVGLRRAKEIALLDEPIGPQRAVELGIATEVVPETTFDERLSEVASRLARGPTSAFGEIKRLMTGSFERSLPDQLAAETNAISKATRTEDYERGHAAFATNENPEFVGK